MANAHCLISIPVLIRFVISVRYRLELFVILPRISKAPQVGLVWFFRVTLAPPHHHAAASQSQHQVESGTSSSCGKQTKVSDVTCGDVRGRWSAGLVAKLRKDGKESKYNKGWAGAWWVGVSWVPFTPRVDVSCPCCAAEDSCRQSFSESIRLRFSPINPGGSCSKASEVLLSLLHWQQLVNM